MGSIAINAMCNLFIQNLTARGNGEWGMGNREWFWVLGVNPKCWSIIRERLALDIAVRTYVRTPSSPSSPLGNGQFF